MKCEKCGTINGEQDRFCRHCGHPLVGDDQWYYSVNDQTMGPYTQEEMQEKFQNKEIDANTMVWQDGMDEWVPMKETSMVINKDDEVWFISLDEDSEPSGPFSTSKMIELFENKQIDEQTSVWKEGQEDWCYLPQSALAEFLPVKTDEEVEEMEKAEQFIQQPEKEKKPWTMVVIIASVLAVVLGGVMIYSLNQWTSQQEQEEARQQQEAKEKEEQEAKQKEEEKKKAEEKEKARQEKEKENQAKQEEIKQMEQINAATRQALYPYYINMASYQSQAMGVQSDFEANVLKGDVNRRIEHYNQAVALYNTLNAEVANVSAVGVDGRSDYVNDYEQMVQCYTDLRDYVGTYVDAWDVSTRYEKPEEHKDEIMAIVENAKGGGTQNASLVDFNNRFAMINMDK
ncbi:MAG: DUF4339 domain-containing protein [Erysipelotrichaceae bacterium]|nr:DUF4339 domain-containing protein [Erysipelotrichaceae bacterium]